MEYLQHNFLVLIPLSSRNLPVDAHARVSMASTVMELRLGKLCQNGDHQMMFTLAQPLAAAAARQGQSGRRRRLREKCPAKCFELGQIMVFGPGKGPAGHARVFGMETDTKKSRAEANGGILVRRERQNGNSGYNNIDREVTGFIRVMREPRMFRRLHRALGLTPGSRAEFILAKEKTLDSVENARRAPLRFTGQAQNA